MVQRVPLDQLYLVRRQVQTVPRAERPLVSTLLYRLSWMRQSKLGRTKKIYKFMALYKGTNLPADMCYKIAKMA